MSPHKKNPNQPSENTSVTLDARSLNDQRISSINTDSTQNIAINKTLDHEALTLSQSKPIVAWNLNQQSSLTQTLDHHPSSDQKPLSYGLKHGEYLGHFEVLRELGRGGMGTVYEAFNHTLNRRVALKVLHVKEQLTLESLKSEARSIAQLEHPNIVQVYHLGELEYQTEKALFIEMQLVAGRPLNQILEDDDLGVTQCLHLLNQLLKALQHAHDRGVIHRDIKPDNVIVTSEGIAKLVDFGISADLNQQSSHQGASRAGTPAFMSPEVWTEGGWSVQSDLYAFGVSAYWMLSKRFPYTFPQNQGWVGIMQTHLNDQIEPLENLIPLPKALSKLLMSCLDKSPDRRPPSARDVSDEIERHLDEMLTREHDLDLTIDQSKMLQVLLWVNRHKQSFFAVLMILVINFLSIHLELFRRLDDDALDLLQSRQPVNRPTPVGIIGLDEAVYIDRDRHMNRESLARMVKQLFRRGVKSIGIDLIQDEPSSKALRLRDHWWQQAAQDPRLVISMALIDSSEKIQRSQLHSTEVDLLTKHGIQLLFDQFSPDPQDLALTSAEILLAGEQGLNPTQGIDEYVPSRQNLEPYLDQSLKRTRNRYMRISEKEYLILPYPELLKATQALGHIHLTLEDDGVIRKAPLLMRYKDRVFPSLGLLLAMRTLGAGLQDLDYVNDRIILSPPGHEPIYIPVNDRAEMSIRVRGSMNDRHQPSLLAFTQAQENEQIKLKAQSYIVGPTASIAGDQGTISHWRNVPKSYAHVLVAENIINGDFMYPIRLRWLLSLTAIASLLAYLFTLRSKPEWGILTTFVSLAGISSLCLLVLFYYDHELPLITISSQVLLACLIAMTVKELRSRQAQKELTIRLGEALPPRVADAIIKGNDTPLRLVKPQRRLITLVCIELSPLDELGDQLSPKILSTLLNQLSEELQALSIEFGALMVPSHRSATHIVFLRSSAKHGSMDALRFVLKVKKCWTEMLWRWKQESAQVSLSIVVGQGRCTWGILGVTKRSELGVQGTFVNRLESLTTLAQEQILMTHDVVQELKPIQQNQKTIIKLKARKRQPQILLTLSPGPSLKVAQEEEEPLTCYYLTASHQES